MSTINFRPAIRRDIFKFTIVALLSGLVFFICQGQVSKQFKSPKTSSKIYKIEKKIQKGISKLPYGELTIHGLFALIAIGFAFRTATTSIRLDPANIRIDEGIIIRKMESISLTAVKDHEITTNLLEQVLGICTLHVISNDKTSPVLKLRGLPKRIANDVYDHMRLNAANSVVELIKMDEAKRSQKDKV